MVSSLAERVGFEPTGGAGGVSTPAPGESFFRFRYTTPTLEIEDGAGIIGQFHI
jgi:hypothetical protein